MSEETQATQEEIVEFTERSLEQKVKDFSDLLNDIDNVNDKRKRLWKEIYENAVSDRQNSYLMFAKLVKIAQDKTTEHAVHGRTIATFLERMSKANDQLIKLAELVDRAHNKESGVDPDSLFDMISNKKGR